MSWCLGFLVSHFQSSKVPKLQSLEVSKIQRFKNSKITFLDDIDPILPKFTLRVFWKILIPYSSFSKNKTDLHDLSVPVFSKIFKHLIFVDLHFKRMFGVVVFL